MPRVVSFKHTKNHYQLVSGEHAPWWVTVFFITRADGAAPVSPCIIHQGATPGEDHSGIVDYKLHALGPDLEAKYIPSDFLYWQNPAGYNDQAGFMQICKHFVSFARNAGNEGVPLFLTLDAHSSHLDPAALDYLMDNNIYVFFLRANNSDNDQPNDNGPNAKLKSLVMRHGEDYFSKVRTFRAKSTLPLPLDSKVNPLSPSIRKSTLSPEKERDREVQRSRLRAKSQSSLCLFK